MTLKEVEGNPGIEGDPGPRGPQGAPSEGYNYGFKPGQWYTNWGHLETEYTFASFASYDSALMVQPFLVPRDTDFELFGAEVITGAVGAQIMPGIYRDNGGGAPGALFIQGVSMSCASAGLKTNGAGGGPGIGVTLTRGLYWLASILDLVDANLEMRAFYPRSQDWIMHAHIGQEGTLGVVANGVFANMPDPFPGANSNLITGIHVPKIMLKAAPVV